MDRACECARRWRSFFTSGSSAVYLFLYSAFYFYTKLDITKARPDTLNPRPAHRLLLAGAMAPGALPAHRVRTACTACVQAARLPCAQ